MPPNPYPKYIQKTKKSMQLEYVCIEFVVVISFITSSTIAAQQKLLYYHEACQIPEVMEYKSHQLRDKALKKLPIYFL